MTIAVVLKQIVFCILCTKFIKLKKNTRKILGSVVYHTSKPVHFRFPPNPHHHSLANIQSSLTSEGRKVNIHMYEGMIHQQATHAGRSPFEPTSICQSETARCP